jgi:hypothetical protein
MFNDRQVVHAQAKVYFEKVKDDLDVAQLGMQECSKMCLEFQEVIPTQFFFLKELLLIIAFGIEVGRIHQG